MFQLYEPFGSWIQNCRAISCSLRIRDVKATKGLHVTITRIDHGRLMRLGDQSLKGASYGASIEVCAGTFSA